MRWVAGSCVCQRDVLLLLLVLLLSPLVEGPVTCPKSQIVKQPNRQMAMNFTVAFLFFQNALLGIERAQTRLQPRTRLVAQPPRREAQSREREEKGRERETQSRSSISTIDTCRPNMRPVTVRGSFAFTLAHTHSHMIKNIHTAQAQLEKSTLCRLRAAHGACRIYNLPQSLRFTVFASDLHSAYSVPAAPCSVLWHSTFGIRHLAPLAPSDANQQPRPQLMLVPTAGVGRERDSHG